MNPLPLDPKFPRQEGDAAQNRNSMTNVVNIKLMLFSYKYNLWQIVHLFGPGILNFSVLPLLPFHHRMERRTKADEMKANSTGDILHSRI